MDEFITHFLLCNIVISIIIGIFLVSKWIFKNTLTSRMQYNLWYFLLVLLLTPFFPVQSKQFPDLFSWLNHMITSPAFQTVQNKTVNSPATPSTTSDWMNEFTISVNSSTPTIIRCILLCVWIAGMFVMFVLALKSSLQLRSLKRSALPLQNTTICKLYKQCLFEMKITRNIPIYSTAFLKTPIITGIFKTRIYMPIHLISDHQKTDVRYILLHELQHYKHKDSLANYLMILTAILYRFNPIIWYALKEMRNDREIACDTSVLKMLDECDYEKYGNTLINFAEKISSSPFPFAAGLGGNIKQIRRRIISIASYKNPSFHKKAIGIITFMLITAGIISFTPFISSYAAINNQYNWNYSSENITQTDLSSYFKNYEGSFVLFDSNRDSWIVYDMEHATHRISPDSTYKIYDALWGLEENIITPQNSLLMWNGKNYPFETWNSNQTLQSAMTSSVNWYFQAIDEQLASTNIRNYIQQIGYGNENVSGRLSTYWLESSLKISPVEQVKLLTKLQNNSLGFSSENINAVKDAICLSSSDAGTFYGKTGTGRVDGQDVNGWFIGYIETADNTYFFATNIGADSDATGGNATEITMSILSDMNIWK